MHVLTIIFPLLIAVLASCNSSSNSEWNKALEDSNNSSIDKRKRSVTSEQILGQWKEVAYSFSARDNERLTADLVGGIYFTQDTVYFLEKGDSIVSLSAKFEVQHDSLLVYFENSDSNQYPYLYNIWFYDDTLVRRDWLANYQHYRSSYYLKERSGKFNITTANN